MKKETDQQTNCFNNICSRGHDSHCGSGSSSAIYGLGVVGALFYFLQHAGTFSAVMIGIGKAFFWPAILMYQLLSTLHL